jgi:hypothetical protein
VRVAVNGARITGCDALGRPTVERGRGMEGQQHGWSTDGRWTAYAHRILRGSLCIAAATTLSVLVLVRVSGAVCCVCEGNFVLGCTTAPPTCTACAGFCAASGATERACCDNVADCSGGVADSCTAGQTACAQPFAGAGQFCDGTCAGGAPTPTATASGSPTVTRTVTPTSTPGPAAPAPTLSVHGWLAALAVLVAVATLALRRRRWGAYRPPAD